MRASTRVGAGVPPLHACCYCMACTVLLLYMHAQDPLLWLCGRQYSHYPPAHAPSLPIICPTSTASILPDRCTSGGGFPLLLHPIPSTSTSHTPSLHPRRGFPQVCLGLEHFGCIRNPVGTTCRHHQSTGPRLCVGFFVKGARSMWSICDCSWIDLCCPTCRTCPGAYAGARPEHVFSPVAAACSQPEPIRDFFFRNIFLVWKTRREMRCQCPNSCPIACWMSCSISCPGPMWDAVLEKRNVWFARNYTWKIMSGFANNIFFAVSILFEGVQVCQAHLCVACATIVSKRTGG